MKYILIIFACLFTGLTVPLFFFNPLKENKTPFQVKINDPRQLKENDENARTERLTANTTRDLPKDDGSSSGDTTAQQTLQATDTDQLRSTKSIEPLSSKNQSTQRRFNTTQNFYSVSVRCHDFSIPVNLRYYPSLVSNGIAYQICQQQIEVIDPKVTLDAFGVRWVWVRYQDQNYWIAENLIKNNFEK